MPMIELTDAAYRIAVERSVADGFATVDEYVVDMVTQGAAGDVEATPNLDHLFTPERMAEIAIGRADAAAGRTMTRTELDAAFAERRAEWLAER